MNTLTLVYIAVIFVAFYFLLIRPQQKRAKEQSSLMASLKHGDRIVTIGGLFGTIERIDDDVIELRISDGVVVDVARSAVARRVDSAGHVVEDEPVDDEEKVPLPPKPRSQDAGEPKVDADVEKDEDAGDSAKAASDETMTKGK